MKKTLSFVIGAAMLVAACASLTACGEKPAPAPAPETTAAETTAVPTTAAETVAEETQPEYMGYQYAAKDPWGGEVSITLREEKDGKLIWTYTDVLEENLMVYQEVTSDYTNGYTEWTIEGKIDDNNSYKYAGNLQLMGGGVQLTYTDGAVTTHSEANGDSNAYQVGPLLDNGTNTVFLEKTADNK